MGWQDRQYNDGMGRGRGGFGPAIRRIFGEGENPLTWSLPLYRLWGIAVRVHLFYVIYIIAQLIRSISLDAFGLTYMAIGMSALFVLVLLHEYGHCVACRMVEGEADRIVMWPLGGLAYCMPPHTARANLITAVGGPGVNVLLTPILALALLLVTGSAAGLVFNPFTPGAALNTVFTRAGTQPLWLITLWWSYYLNLVLLGFNVLVPMYPMDGGRILHALLWERLGDGAALRIATTIGLVAAVLMAVFAIVFEVYLLFAIAIFGGFTCWMERQHMQFESSVPGGYDFSRGYAGLPHESPKPGRAARRRAMRREEEQKELDRLLAKIAKEGMGKLSRRERRFLERESSRRRH